MRGFVVAAIFCSALAAPLFAQVPENAHPTSWGSGWECDTGFLRRAQRCIRIGAATDSEIRKYLIAESLAGYPGNCPCPYKVDRAGRRCGGRSAYSRAGGYAPLCYERDVSEAMVRRARSEYPPT